MLGRQAGEDVSEAGECAWHEEGGRRAEEKPEKGQPRDACERKRGKAEEKPEKRYAIDACECARPGVKYLRVEGESQSAGAPRELDHPVKLGISGIGRDIVSEGASQLRLG